MPRTAASTTKRQAIDTVNEQQKMPEDMRKEVAAGDGGKNPYEVLTSLGYDDMASCLEYIFLLREIHGMKGFETDIAPFRSMLKDAWKQIISDGLLPMFRGRRPGFMRIWLTPGMAHKLQKASIAQWAQWLTYFDSSAPYRLEMLTAQKHLITLAGLPRTDIVNWLEGK